MYNPMTRGQEQMADIISRYTSDEWLASMLTSTLADIKKWACANIQCKCEGHKHMLLYSIGRYKAIHEELWLRYLHRQLQACR